jgi:prepilin peptidase CpaA
MFLSPFEFHAVVTGAALIMLAFAVREDLLRQRIPNALNAAVLVLGLAAALLARGWSGLLNSAGGALVGCAALVPFYLLRGMGAGDVKLMSAAGAFLGPTNALLAAALSLIAGGVLGVAIVIWRLIKATARPGALLAGGVPAAGPPSAIVSVARKERFPYAVAIAVGVVVTLWLQGSLWVLVTALGIR